MNIGGVAIPEHVIQGTPKFSLAVPSDSTVLSNVRSVLCTVAGTLQAQNDVPATVAIVCVVGQVVPISPSKIMAATTGTYILLF